MLLFLTIISSAILGPFVWKWCLRRHFKTLYNLYRFHKYIKKNFLKAVVDIEATFFGAKFFYSPKRLICINDPKLCGEFLNSTAGLDKGPFYNFMKPLFGDGIITANSHVWHPYRKVISPTLNTVKVKSHLQIFTEGSNDLAKTWEKKIGEVFEPYRDVSRATFAFTMRTALGMDADWSESQLDEMILHVNRIGAGIAYRFSRHWLFPNIIFNLSHKGREVAASSAAFRKVLSSMIATKSELNTNDAYLDDGGFISHLLAASKSNSNFPESAVIEELATYMTAGFESTSTSITFALVMLGSHPHVQEKVYEEQVTLLGIDGTPDWNTVIKMDYMDRFVKETLRFFPFITMIGRQLYDDVTVGGYVFPKGASVVLPIFAIHRRREIWDNPMEFNPDRFSPEEEKKRSPFAFLPFGGGPRVCMGQKYAMTAIKVMLSAIIRRYKIKTNHTMDKIDLSKSSVILIGGKDLNIILERR